LIGYLTPGSHVDVKRSSKEANLCSGQPYKTVNGVEATGGAMEGPGAVIVDGILYVNSGYGLWGGGPGNVLLAFSVDGQWATLTQLRS